MSFHRGFSGMKNPIYIYKESPTRGQTQKTQKDQEIFI